MAELWYKKDNAGRMFWRAELTEEEKANPEKLPVIDLSRLAHGRCKYRLDKLEQHDGCAPSRFKNEAERDAYVKRIVASMKTQMAKKGDVVCGFTKAT